MNYQIFILAGVSVSVLISNEYQANEGDIIDRRTHLWNTKCLC